MRRIDLLDIGLVLLALLFLAVGLHMVIAPDGQSIYHPPAGQGVAQGGFEEVSTTKERVIGVVVLLVDAGLLAVVVVHIKHKKPAGPPPGQFMGEGQLLEHIVATVEGDLRSFERLCQLPPTSIDGQSEALPALTVKTHSVFRVLMALRYKDFSPSLIQRWESFIRLGYLGTAQGPRRPNTLRYEPAWEDRIGAIVARLDELGATGGSEITAAELAEMVQSIKRGG